MSNKNTAGIKIMEGGFGQNNHKGNYQISVSFDVFGEIAQKKSNQFVSCLQKDMKSRFKQWLKNTHANRNVKIKNVRWE